MDAQTVIVTGASGRLGAFLVRRLQEHGASVAAVARQPLAPSALSADSRAFSAEFLDADSVKTCARSIGDHYGRVDGLIHAAGAWAPTPIATTPLDGWESVLRVNLASTFLWFQEGVELLRDGGRLIAFASGQGADRAAGEQSAYSAAKAGVIRLVEAAAVEFGPRKITAHAIAPSMITYNSDSPGVSAEDIWALCRHLLSPAGAALNGETIRAYGTADV